MDMESETYRQAILEPSSTLVALLGVAEKGQKMYERSQSKASQESHRRAKELVSGGTRGLAGSEREVEGVHPIFGIATDTSTADMLAAVNAFRPHETVFEFGSRGKNVASQIMHKRRVTLAKSKAKAPVAAEEDQDATITGETSDAEDMGMVGPSAAEEEIASVFDTSRSQKPARSAQDYRDPSVYMGYKQEGADAERGYSLTDGFASQAASATFDLTATDENAAHSATQKASMLRWDRRHKKFVKGDGTGADNKKLIRTESGAKLPASFKSGSFDDWKKKQKLYLPKTGEAELRDRNLPSTRKFRFEGSGKTSSKPRRDGKGGVEKEFGNKGGKGKKTKSSAHSAPKSSLKSVDQIRKERVQKAKRVKRSNQPRKR